MNDKGRDARANELTPGMRFREYGALDDDWLVVADLTRHGDSVLVTATTGDERTYDIDEVLLVAGPEEDKGDVWLLHGYRVEEGIATVTMMSMRRRTRGELNTARKIDVTMALETDAASADRLTQARLAFEDALVTQAITEVRRYGKP